MKKGIIPGALLQLVITVGVGLGGSAHASAGSITWTLQNVTLTQFGTGTASGSFDYDADTGTYSNVNILTSAGTNFIGQSVPGADYLFANSARSNASMLQVTTVNSFTIGTSVVDLSFASALTDAGGTVTLGNGPASPILEGTCGNPSCGPINTSRIGSGSITTVSSTPEPSSILLAAAGLAALAGTRRRLL